jgi:hypothetical protein
MGMPGLSVTVDPVDPYARAEGIVDPDAQVFDPGLGVRRVRQLIMCPSSLKFNSTNLIG